MLENKERYLALLKDFSHREDSLSKSYAILSVLTEALKSVGIQPILVGGKAVELYTRGRFTTYDIDLVLPNREKAGKILEDLGFEKRLGDRHWYHSDLDYAIEIPDHLLAGSMDKVNEVEIEGTPIYVIGFEDLIADRIRACYFWKSLRDCEQAENLLTVHLPDLDQQYLLDQLANDKLENELGKLLEKARANRERLGLE